MNLGGAKISKHYSASDYVQDGLFAMWDAIENRGRGVHYQIEQSQGYVRDRMWVEWVSETWLAQPNYDMYSTADGIGITTPSSCAFYVNDALKSLFNSNIFTVEACGRVMKISAINDRHVIQEPTYLNFDIFNRNNNFYALARGKGVIVPTTSLKQIADNNYAALASVSCDNGDIQSQVMTADGSFKVNDTSTATTGDVSNIQILRNGNASVEGRVLHCMRFYDRVLTDAERDHNRRIDRIRFSLP